MEQAQQPRAAASDATRFSQIDGLRAIAILAVVVYHYAVFWTPSGNGDALLPYGDALAWIPFAGQGHQGVYLFFIVSGFVISLSLQRASTLLEFAILRAIRLWPTLLICGTLTFAATTLFGPDVLRRSVAEYLISLTFLPPAHVGKLIGESGLNWIDGAYWTLWTEVRFYALSAIMFFVFRKHFLLCWLVFFAASTALGIMALAAVPATDPVARLIFADHQPYFTMGIALAAMRERVAGPLPMILLVTGAALALFYSVFGPGFAPKPFGIEEAIAYVAVVGLGSLGALALRPVPVLSWRWLVIVGQASYAYYLLHQSFGLALMSAIGVTGMIGMLAIQVLVLALSIVLTNNLETPVRRALRRKVRAMRKVPA